MWRIRFDVTYGKIHSRGNIINNGMEGQSTIDTQTLNLWGQGDRLTVND